jgi:hypothetical protein
MQIRNIAINHFSMVIITGYRYRILQRFSALSIGKNFYCVFRRFILTVLLLENLRAHLQLSV